MPDPTLPDPAIAERVVEAAERLWVAAREGSAEHDAIRPEYDEAFRAWRGAVGEAVGLGGFDVSSARLALAYSRRIAELEGSLAVVADRLRSLERWDMLCLTDDGHGYATADAPWARRLIASCLADLGERVSDPVCVARWPGCESGAFDPRCCRFPKSCSCTVLPNSGQSPPTRCAEGGSTRRSGE